MRKVAWAVGCYLIIGRSSGARNELTTELQMLPNLWRQDLRDTWQRWIATATGNKVLAIRCAWRRSHRDGAQENALPVSRRLRAYNTTMVGQEWSVSSREDDYIILRISIILSDQIGPDLV